MLYKESAVKPIVRYSLLLIMLLLGYQTSLRYAFAYESGYPLLPLLALGFCFSLYVRLLPSHIPSPVEYATHNTDPLLVLMLATLACSYLLHLRGEQPFSPGWILHLSALTFFTLLIPFMVIYPFTPRLKTLVATLTALLLAVLFWRGTEMSQQAKINQVYFHLQNPPVRSV